MKSITLLFAIFLALPLVAQAQSVSEDCSYADADLYAGWGWNPVAGESCPPVDTTAPVVMPGSCDYSGADVNGGWGWDPVSNTSCAPLDEVTSSGGNSQSGQCDYSDAAVNGGWGWNPVTRTGCAPLDGGGSNSGSGSSTNSKHPQCSSANADPDGDGYGWENSATCVVGSGGGAPVAGLSPTGNIQTGTPAYSWPAVANAEKYRIVVRDSGDSGFSHEVDPLAAGCQTGTGTCSAKPDLGYFDNNLSWHVETTVNGNASITSGPVSFKTPVSLDLQPITSNPDACEAYASVAYDKFVVINNIWNARSMYKDGWYQKISVDQTGNSSPVASWEYDWLAESDGGIYEVKSYPEIAYGNKLGVHVSGTKAETGLPEKVSDLEEFVVEYSYTDSGNAERNVALESFFHETCDITGPCDTYDNRAFEMMIWVENPTQRRPGKLALTGVMIDNKLWDVYIKPDSNKKYIAFTAQTAQPSGTLNWNRFVDWTVAWTRDFGEEFRINNLKTEFCMGAIELGTEVFNGKGKFTLDSYKISRQ